VSIRVPKELKEEMDKLKDMVDWASEIRSFIEERVRKYKRIRALNELEKTLEELPETPKGLATELVREDRERY
jgi:predicted DNA-binding protein